MIRGSEQVTVAETISSRYANNKRPLSWEQRREGFDVVQLTDGRVIKLFSNAQQGVPAKGWILVIEPLDDYYKWTLYGFLDETEFSPEDF
ncbi:MAG: hypothetical protein NZO16_04745 [Deltaproteobacteria bacterium]|nr:hypothetical protein [Deltaproteobacteria bacterium]